MSTLSQSWNPSTIFADLDLDQEEVQTVVDEVVSFHSEFRHCFGRSEQERLGLGYLFGLLGDTRAKSAEPIAQKNIGKSFVRSLQRFKKFATWDHNAMLRTHQEKVAKYLSSPEGMITVDNFDFEKKGTHSVGVARQYCCRLGKKANCQSGVFAGYASEYAQGLVDCQLFMPEQWFNEEYKELRAKNLVPENLEFWTKQEIALGLIDRVKETFSACWIGCDSTLGTDDNFIGSLPQELLYFADVTDNEKVFLKKPKVGVPSYQGKGRPPSKKRILFGRPQKISEIARSGDFTWHTVSLDEGTQEPLQARVACRLVYPLRKGFPKEEPVWLFARKCSDGQIRYAFSNAPGDTSLKDLCRASINRWHTEQCFDECTSYLGMDAYEHRSWPAWHRHMIYVMLAQEFLIRMRQRSK